jgi:hypothetical protein
MNYSFSTRLVTRNLLVSATNYLRDQAMTVSNFHDLCTLINLAILNDDLITIGNQSEVKDTHKPYIAAAYEKVKDLTGIKIKVETPKISEIIENTDYLNGGQCEPLKKALENEVSDRPDYPKDFEEGKSLFKQQSNNINDRSINALDFYCRSFIYVGFAQTSNVPFAPDYVRNIGLKNIENNNYQNKFLTTIKDIYGEEIFQNTIGTNLEIPPFPAVVFKRAENRDDISNQIANLRNELEAVRNTLKEFAQERNWGVYYKNFQTLFAPPSTQSTRNKIVNDKVDKELKRLREETEGIKGLVTRMKIKPAVEVLLFAYKLLKIITSPDPGEIAEKAEFVKDLIVTGPETVFQLFNKPRFAEVQLIEGDLRSWFQNNKIDVKKLFGEIILR